MDGNDLNMQEQRKIKMSLHARLWFVFALLCEGDKLMQACLEVNLAWLTYKLCNLGKLLDLSVSLFLI